MNNHPEFHTPEITREEHESLRRLYAGTASEYQQRLALYVIVNKFSRAQDVLYIPGDTHASAFLEGRGFVGQKVLKYLNLPVGKLDELPSDLTEKQRGDNQ